MSFATTAYNIMIASPSDVQVERNIVREVVHEWNVVNAAIPRHRPPPHPVRSGIFVATRFS
jgi:hypothetical protein